MAKRSPEEIADQRRQQEARRDPKKDRSSHASGRGKKMTLDALSKEVPTAIEVEQFLKTLNDQDDRSAAIMATSFVEMTLQTAIRCRLADPGDEITKSWFYGATAPFGTFSAKIKLGQALAIYGPQMAARLNGIREIRNVFAHRVMPLDFHHPVVKDACIKMAPFMKTAVKQDDYKMVFITGCYVQARSLIDYALEEGGKDLEVRYP